MNNLPQSKKWYVIVAKAIHYKKAAAILEKLGFSFYLPIQRQLHYWSDRKKWIDVPILNPYIFLFTNEVERKVLFESCNFFHFLSFEGKLTTIIEEEIDKVKLLCNSSSKVKIENHAIKKGDRVEIIDGPFLGMKGFALQENGKYRFLVEVLNMGHFASVEIDSNWIRNY
ncbi:MAG: UpxY family transcription antiterminator [Bacteroidia bacterium]